MGKGIRSMVLLGAAGGLGVAYKAWRYQEGLKAAHVEEIYGSFASRYGPWAIITGAAREEGIGFGFARHLAGKGLNLVLVDIEEEALKQRASELQDRYYVKVKTVALDLGEPDFLEWLLPEVEDVEPGLLVCNHMYTPSDTPPILEMELATHERMLDVNARAYLKLAHTFGRRMVEQGRGGIILVTSGAGFMGTPYTGAYSANKAFQTMFGEALWYELRDSGVDVLVLAPGLTDTQGDALAGYPQFMIMEVDPVVAETLSNLGRKHLVIPGTVNKLFHFVTNKATPRRRAVEMMGGFMAKGLGKE